MNKWREMQKLLAIVKFHPFFWLVLIVGVITGHFRELLTIFIIVFVHEMGHAIAANAYGWRIQKIQLLPFGGVAEMDEHGNRPLKEELIVILSGPLQHIWMGGLAYLLYSFSILDEYTYSIFFMQNVMILIFNLLPIWPLDGGKLLLCFISYRFTFSDSQKYCLLFSFIVLICFVGISLLKSVFPLYVLTILVFLVMAIYLEWKRRNYVQIRFLLERHYGRNNHIKKIKLIKTHEDEYIYPILTRFCRGCKHQIVVEFNNSKQMTIDETEVLHAYFSNKLTTSTIGEIARMA